MTKEKINILRSEMRKVMDGFNLKFKSECGKCGHVQEVDYFDYYANPFVLCFNCEKRATNSDSISFEDLPFYKRKFIDGHFKVVTALTTCGIDFSHNIEKEQGKFFDDNQDFASGVSDIYTSFEMFLYDLTFKRVEEFMKTGKTLEIGNLDLEEYPKIPMIAEKINSIDRIKINQIFDGISNNFRVKDCTKLLKIIGSKDEKNFSRCYNLQKERNDIVHRGKEVNFENYANAFIVIGNLFNIYKMDNE